VAPSGAVFHVELRQFPNSTRAFNLTREELESKILGPWVRGQPVELHERRWSPDRAKLEIYEGRALATEEIGMGRGWANVTRTGEDVTERLLEELRLSAHRPPELEQLKRELLARASARPVSMAAVFDLAGELRSELSANERVEFAARAIWELLQDGSLELSRGR
jgi:hypothetical protein